MVFAMFDSKGTKLLSFESSRYSLIQYLGRQGGASDVRTVSVSSDSSCLDSSAPSSTSNAPTASSSSTGSSSTTSSTPSNTQTSEEGSTSVGAIIGTAVGSIIALAVLVTLGMFFLRRRRKARTWRHSRRNTSVDLLGKPGGHGGPVSHVYAYPHPTIAPYASEGLASHDSLNVIPGRSQHDGSSGTSPFLPTSHSQDQYQPEPYILPPLGSPSATTVTDQDGRSRRASASQSQSSSARRKASLAGVHNYSQPTRFVVHTDLEEIQPDENGVVELPPQYTPHRTPIPAEQIASMQMHVPSTPQGHAVNQASQLLPRSRPLSPFADEAAVPDIHESP
jgi:hypothetical protein